MAVVPPGPGRTALGRRAVVAALAAAVASSCGTRDVFLAPDGVQVRSTGGAANQSRDSGPSTFDAGPRDARPDGADVCVVDHLKPEPQPLGIYIMVDQSSSMTDVWDPVVQAIGTFISDSGAQPRVSAGIQYFALSPATPFLPPDWNTTVCQAAAYATPDVEIAPLPGNELPLLTSLGQHGPLSLAQLYGGILGAQFWLVDSPTDAALAGAIAGARNWDLAHADEDPRAVVLLVTDGVPSTATSPNCQATLDASITAATDGFNGTPSIATYVLGVGEQLGDLDRIAAAGGTEYAHVVQSTTPTDIVNELAAVRSAAVPCRFTVDTSWLATDRLNVDLVAADGTHRMKRVAGPEACVSDGGTKERWYPTDPNEVVLCPETCDGVRSLGNISLDVVYGCPTVIAQ